MHIYGYKLTCPGRHLRKNHTQRQRLQQGGGASGEEEAAVAMRLGARRQAQLGRAATSARAAAGS